MKKIRKENFVLNDDIFTMKVMEYGISPLPNDPVPAMAYVPFQNSDKMYSAEQGIVMGTMFPVLNKPFIGCGGRKA